MLTSNFNKVDNKTDLFLLSKNKYKSTCFNDNILLDLTVAFLYSYYCLFYKRIQSRNLNEFELMF